MEGLEAFSASPVTKVRVSGANDYVSNPYNKTLKAFPHPLH
jgi:hypothetical protein